MTGVTPPRVDAQAAEKVRAAPPKLAVDADGFVWRVYDEHWSMAPSNPDNEPVPQPVTFYEPVTDEHSHAFQDEYQRLWHEAAAELVSLRDALERAQADLVAGDPSAALSRITDAQPGSADIPEGQNR